MPLLRNTGQPYFTNPGPNNIPCEGNYCYPILPGDEVITQFYQTPCGDNLIEDPEFGDQTIGAELLTNGSFTASLAPWVETPTSSWYYSGGLSGSAVYDPAYYVNSLAQTVAITPGSRYRLTFTVTGLTPGNYLDILLGSSTQTAVVNADGTYTFDLIAGSDNSDLNFQAVSINSITLDTVSLKENTLNKWDLNGLWSVQDGSACAYGSGSADLIETVANYIVNGDYYSLTFTISGMSVGFVQAFIANQGQTFTENGTYTIYKTPSAAGVVKFTRSVDFNGCISNPDLRKLKNDYDFSAATDSDEIDITSYAEYVNEFITIRFNPYNAGLDFGCFKIQAFDTCTKQYDDVVTNGGFNSGSVSGVTGWTENNGSAQYDFSGNNAKFIYSGSAPQSSFPILINAVNPNLVAGNYEVTFTIVSNSDTTNIGIAVYIDTYFQSPVTYYSAPGTYTYQILNYDPNGPVPIGGSQRVRVVANFEKAAVKTAGNIIIDNVKVNRIEPFDATYISDCIQYENSFSFPTRMIQAYCDTNNMGFDFENTGFVLQQRVECRSINPFYPSNANIQQYGSGNARLTYSDIEKYWELHTGFLSESAHDALAIMRLCDHFLIGIDANELTEYLTDKEDYSPAWQRNGDYDLATSVINLRIKANGQKFNRQC